MSEKPKPSQRQNDDAVGSAAVAKLLHLSDEQRRGLRDYFDLYLAHYTPMNETLLKDLESDPEWGPIIRAIPKEVQDAQNRTSLELLRRAILDNDWEPLLVNMRTQGAQYAEMGVAFALWYGVLGMVRTYLVPEIVKTLGKTRERMMSAILGLDIHMDLAMAVIGEAYLETKQGLIRQQQAAILELSAPVLPVRDRLLLQPIVGIVDTQRARQIADGLLQAIRTHRAKVVVIDITGVAAVDSKVANHLLQAAAAARLMGAIPIITGVSASVAQSLVALGVDLGAIATIGDLRGGIEKAEQLLGLRVVAISGAAQSVPATART